MIIEIKRKAFGEKIIFEDRKFEIKEGKKTLIKGPSGCGKTTLLRILSGLDGDYIGSLEGKKNFPVILFQEDRLSLNISCLSNLMMVTEDKEKARAVLYSVGLGGEEKVKASELSGGMRRRLSIARILLLSGDALFLDEPLRALDDENRRKMAALIVEKFPNITTVIVSHDEDDENLFSVSETIVLD